jgi:prephenate dehydrogenase
MNILIIGAGKMGSWMATVLQEEHQVALLEKNPGRQKTTPVPLLESTASIAAFNPDMVINAVNLEATLTVFGEVTQYLQPKTILADMASVKNGLARFYLNSGFPFVSTHPMFGPTFADMKGLKDENAIIIEESGETGKAFFLEVFRSLGLQIHFMSFHQHDQSMSESLSVPFILSLLFASKTDQKVRPGTTYAQHLRIARAVLSEDDRLLAEVLMNRATVEQINHLEDLLLKIKCMIQENAQEGLLPFIHSTRAHLQATTPRKNPAKSTDPKNDGV